MSLTVREYREGISGEFRPRLVELFKDSKGGILVNYGCSWELSTGGPGTLLINPTRAVASCVEKPRMLELLAGAAGESFVAPHVQSGSLASERLYVLKPIRHKGGKGTRILNGERANRIFDASTHYLEEYIPSLQEWRVGVIGGKSIVRLKVGGMGNIRNRKYGWTLSFPEEGKIPQSIRAAATDAVSILKLDFGVVDVGIRDKGIPVVYEVNSAPHLTTPETIEWYVSRMANYIKRRLK